MTTAKTKFTPQQWSVIARAPCSRPCGWSPIPTEACERPSLPSEPTETRPTPTTERQPKHGSRLQPPGRSPAGRAHARQPDHPHPGPHEPIHRQTRDAVESARMAELQQPRRKHEPVGSAAVPPSPRTSPERSLTHLRRVRRRIARCDGGRAPRRAVRYVDSRRGSDAAVRYRERASSSISQRVPGARRNRSAAVSRATSSASATAT
jgi:hypothetical protein